MGIEKWIINEEDFLQSRVEERLELCILEDQGSLRSALKYLYGDIVSINKERIKVAEKYLSLAEKKIINWLHTRTDGNLKASYGSNALKAARGSRYKCSTCGHGEVRALELDHVNGKGSFDFACLCSNCHAVKSHIHDYTGKLNLDS